MEGERHGARVHVMKRVPPVHTATQEEDGMNVPSSWGSRQQQELLRSSGEVLGSSGEE